MGRYHQGISKGWKKSTHGSERYDSSWELQYMDELDKDPMITKWTKHHGLRIPYRKWWGARGHYVPDFLVELVGGTKELREVKGTHLFQDMNTARKLKAGDEFCRSRGMVYRVITKDRVDPALWTPTENIVIEEAVTTQISPTSTPAPVRTVAGQTPPVTNKTDSTNKIVLIVGAIIFLALMAKYCG